MIHIKFKTVSENKLPSSRQLNNALQSGLKQVSFDWFSRIMQRNPVDTGRSRAAWRINKATGNSYHINNNIKYIRVLEYGGIRGNGSKITGDGHSTQAPNGIVRVTLKELTPLVNGIMEQYLDKL